MNKTPNPTGVSLPEHFVAGRTLASTDDEKIEVRNPRTGELSALIPAGDPADVGPAISAARNATPYWRSMSRAHRADAVRAAGQALGQHAAELSELEVLETGRPEALTRVVIDSVIGLFVQFADLAEVHGEEVVDGSDRILRVPYGVAALITPWNFPLAVAFDSLPALLVTGNTVIWKPSEKTPLASRRAAEIIAAEVPAGTLSLLLGDARVGQPLVESDGIDLVVFTGSTAAGREIGAICGGRVIPALLELGGKDPVIVDAGVDPRWAAEQVATGAFMNSGQICVSMERVYVHSELADDFVEELAKQAADQDLGPLQDERQRKLVDAHVSEALAAGAELVSGGQVPQGPGYYYPATVLTGVSDDVALMREETFGPVAPIRVVDSFDEALDLAGRSSYGLAATVLTNDHEHAERAARQLVTGKVWVNDWQGGGPGLKYEPARSSGVGVVGAGGMLDAVTRPQAIHQVPASPLS